MGSNMAHPADSAALQPWTWQARPLLVFSPAADDPRLHRQRALLAPHLAGAADRQLIRFEIGSDFVATFPEQADSPNADALREHYRVAPMEFVVLLVGKDGGLKLRETEPVDACRLFTLIDGMPMRRREAGSTTQTPQDPCTNAAQRRP